MKRDYIKTEKVLEIVNQIKENLFNCFIIFSLVFLKCYDINILKFSAYWVFTQMWEKVLSDCNNIFKY